jgi:hypothetical protein
VHREYSAHLSILREVNSSNHLYLYFRTAAELYLIPGSVVPGGAERRCLDCEKAVCLGRPPTCTIQSHTPTRSVDVQYARKRSRLGTPFIFSFETTRHDLHVEQNVAGALRARLSAPLDPANPRRAYFPVVVASSREINKDERGLVSSWDFESISALHGDIVSWS